MISSWNVNQKQIRSQLFEGRLDAVNGRRYRWKFDQAAIHPQHHERNVSPFERRVRIRPPTASQPRVTEYLHRIANTLPDFRRDRRIAVEHAAYRSQRNRSSCSNVLTVIGISIYFQTANLRGEMNLV